MGVGKRRGNGEWEHVGISFSALMQGEGLGPALTWYVRLFWLPVGDLAFSEYNGGGFEKVGEAGRGRKGER